MDEEEVKLIPSPESPVKTESKVKNLLFFFVYFVLYSMLVCYILTFLLII